MHLIQGSVLEALPIAWLITWELAQSGDSALKPVTVSLFSVSNLLPSLQLGASLSSEGEGTERRDKGKIPKDDLKLLTLKVGDLTCLCPLDNLHCPMNSLPHHVQCQPDMSLT